MLIDPIGDLGEERMDYENLEMDKCLEQYTVRIPENLKVEVDKLPSAIKSKMANHIRVLLAKYVHEHRFNPMIYLKTD